MLYIVVSDIHGNIEAFRAVLNTFPDAAEKRVICVGDTVGYGARPNECVDLISSLDAINVMGNHDSVVAGRMDAGYFNEYAREAAEWTKEEIGPAQKAYLEGLPLVDTIGDITVVHGTLDEPWVFNYMLSGTDAMRTFELLETRVCFVGHSHVPDVYVLKGGRLYGSLKERFKVEKGFNYIVNAGSVGQPRDGDRRACYCLYDTDKGVIEFRRVEYDVRSAHDAIIEAGLPSVLAERLWLGT